MRVLTSVILLTIFPNSGAFTTPSPSFVTRTNTDDTTVTHNNAISYINRNKLNSRLQMALAETVEEVEMDTEDRMSKSVESVKKNLQSIRTGRANAAILDLVMVEYYGAPTPLNQMASISVPNSQQLTVEPYDKSILTDIEKAIIESGLGITPSNDGALIRINIPALTEDRRKDLLKQCKAIGEDGKVAIRNVRRDAVDNIKKMEKASTIGEDESKGSQDSIQKLTDKFVKEVDNIVSKKEKEVMTV